MTRKVGAGILVFGLASTASLVVGFATNYWYQTPARHIGLWTQICLNPFLCDLADNIFQFAFMWAVRVLLCLALVLSASGIFANIAWVAGKDEVSQKKACKSTQGLYISSGFFAIIAVVIFGLQIRWFSDYRGTWNLGWSFWCSGVGGPIQLLLGSISSCITRAWMNNSATVTTIIHTYPDGTAVSETVTGAAPVGSAPGDQPPPSAAAYPQQRLGWQQSPYPQQGASYPTGQQAYPYPPGPNALYNQGVPANPTYSTPADQILGNTAWTVQGEKGQMGPPPPYHPTAGANGK